jgi:hypothetical protein
LTTVATPQMRWALLALLVLHGLIHWLGPAKAFGWAELPQLSQPISRTMGWVWLGAAVALLAAAVLLLAMPRIWWAVALLGIALSQAAIASSWADAKWGTLANLIILLAAAHGFIAEGPFGMRAEYRRELAARHTAAEQPAPRSITEADLAHLPEPVARYVRQSGAVGRPQVHRFRATWRGRIRGAADEDWMDFVAQQENFLDEPARFFFMVAKRGGLPVDVFHAFRTGEASMRVRVLSVYPIIAAGGDQLTRAETVTLFNDLCVMAPAALIDPAIRWEPLDDLSARAYYTIGANTVAATLYFNPAGELVDFVSDDRLQASPDGARFTRERWSTPLHEYRTLHGRNVASRAEAHWHPPTGEFSYLELELVDLVTNP